MNFEIEHWPNYFGKHALLRLLKGFIKGWIVLSTIGIVLFGIYFFTISENKMQTFKVIKN